MSRKNLETVSLIVMVGMLTAVSPACKQETPPPPEAVVRPVKTMVVGEEQRTELVFPGVTQASDRSTLSFRVPGQLLEFPVNEGDRVAKGAVVARLDPTDFRLAVEQAKAGYQKSQADYDRYKRLYEREAVPLAELEMRRAMRDVSRTQLDQAEANLRYTWLYAPYTGSVGRKYVENYETVTAGQPIVSLQNLETMEIVLDIPQDIMARTGGGRDAVAVARFAAAPGGEFPLTFKEASAQADPKTQTYEVTFSMKQPEGIKVLPGMTAEVVIRGEVAGVQNARNTSRIAVPVNAVLADTNGKPHVWVVDTTTMQVGKRPVSLGEPTGSNQVWVLDGLETGDTIAVTAVHELKEGDTIRDLPESY